MKSAHLFSLGFLMVVLGCEGTPHGPIEGAGRGAPSSSTQQTVEETLQGLEQMLPPVEASGENKNVKSAMNLPSRQPVRGTLQPGEKHWYKFHTDTPSVLRAEAAQVRGGNLRLSLYGKGGKKLLRRVDNGGDNEDEVISNFLVEGTHYLAVERRKGKKKRKGSCSYAILRVANPPSSEDEREPNGSTKKASQLAQETIVRGYLNNGEDKDYFRVAAPAAHVHALRVHFLGAPGSPAELLFFYEDESKATRSLVPAGERVELLPLRANRETPLFIAVKSVGGFNVNTPYRLEVKSTPLQDNMAVTEPDDAPVDSREIEEKAPGWISWPGDRDYWRVSNAKKGILKVEFSGVPGVALQAAVVDDQDQSLAVVKGNPGSPLVLPNVVASSRPAFIVIEGLNGSFNSRTPYRIQTTWRKGVGEEREPNNEQSIATRGPGISLSQTTEGYLGWAEDVDWLHLDLRDQEVGGIRTLKIKAPDTVTLQARWVDEMGAPLLPPEVVPAGGVASMTTFVMPGSYGIELKGLAGGFSAVASYSVSVQE